MGYLLHAQCTACTYKNQVRFGAGMMDFDERLDVPALDSKGQLGALNIRKPYDDGYRLYSDPSMYEGEIEDPLALQFSEVSLNPAGNKCPGCGKFTMAFMPGALID